MPDVAAIIAADLGARVVPLWIFAGALALVWCALVVAAVVSTRPRALAPVSAGLETPDDTPPAVVALLVDGRRPGRDAATATLADLIHRGVFGLERTDHGLFVVPGPRPGTAGLAPHEELVAHLVTERSVDGSVPASALRLPEGKACDRWLATFDAAVIDDARRRGSSRPRFDARTRFVLRLFAWAPGLVAGLAYAASRVAATTPGRGVTDGVDAAGVVVQSAVIALVVRAVLHGVTRRLHGERRTTSGDVAAARWVGLAERLGEDRIFASLGLDAIVIWGRLVAYGIALDVGHAAAAEAPVGAEERRHAWSAVTGEWRRVRIRHPRRFPPGYGDPTGLNAFRGVAQLLGAAGLAVFVWPILGTVTATWHERTDDLGGLFGPPLSALADLVTPVIVVVTVIMALRGAVLAVGALVGLGHPVVTEGVVLRTFVHQPAAAHDRQWWEAVVDDGTSSTVRALRGIGVLPLGFRRGATVRVVRTRVAATVLSVQEITAG